MAWQVTDLLEETVRRLEEGKVRSPDEVRAAPEPMVGFTPEVRRMKAGLKRRFRKLVPLLLVGLLGWWGYVTFLVPPKAVIIRTRVTNAATQHLMERNAAN